MFADSNYLNGSAEMEEMVVTDGNLITSRGPAATFPFAFRLVGAPGGDAEK